MSDSWQEVLKRVSRKVGRRSFRDWIEPTRLLAFGPDEVVVQAPNALGQEWLARNFAAVVEEVLRELGSERPSTGIPTRVRFVVPESSAPAARLAAASVVAEPGPVEPRPTGAPSARRAARPGARSPRHAAMAGGAGDAVAPPADAEASDPARAGALRDGLDPRYTFENFVVGSCNQFAHAAALAVADQPGRSYNPLYVYGGVGLGKTHLMHAIGHAARTASPGMRLAYVSAERFMCEMINAIRWKRTPEFREKFRSIDMLLVDDIQFLEGKEATQEEFFHTFRTLYEEGKQVVLSSDCPPRELATLAERLRSRFESGLITDMQVPDLETKLAILRRKAESEGIGLPDDVVLFLASKVRSNVRELEGCLTRLMALASLRRRAADLDLAREATRDIFPDDDRPVSVEAIQRFVADYYNVKVTDLKARNNARSVAFPRQVAMYLCKKMTTASFPDIGKRFGGKHHSTVIHSVNKITSEASRSEEFTTLLNRFMESIH